MDLSNDEAMTKACFAFMSEVLSKRLTSAEDVVRAICRIRGFAEAIQKVGGMSDEAFDDFGKTVISFAVLHTDEMISKEMAFSGLPPTWDLFHA